MIKVLISEDEKRICKLIQNIIPWNELGFEIVDFAYSGTEAINKIQLYDPDVVITDIRMPGCTGIEMIEQVNSEKIKFIIISGYKYFEYAKSAIKYGVEDYILKPIDRNELINALVRIKKNYEVLHINIQKDIELKNSKEKIRNNLINNVLLNNNLVKDSNISKINEEFNLHFQKGSFKAIYLKILSEDNEGFNHKNIFNIFIKEFDNLFLDKTHDITNSLYKEGVILLINYRQVDENCMHESLNKFLNIIKKLIGKFQDLNFILTLGNTVTKINEIPSTIYNSINMIKYRVTYGVNTIIDISMTEPLGINGTSILSDKEIWDLKNIVESQNYKGFLSLIDNAFKKVDTKYHGNAIYFFKTLESINETILEVYKSIDVKDNFSEALISQYNRLINIENDRKVLVNKYKLFVVDQLKECNCGVNKKELALITKAKKYISYNYQNAITLEEVAEVVQISPAYLSTMFKKEMGVNFCDYIIELRIELSKEILKTTNLPIAEITEQIGYTDSRYFSKLFDKIVGIKPSKYRKLYNKG